MSIYSYVQPTTFVGVPSQTKKKVVSHFCSWCHPMCVCCEPNVWVLAKKAGRLTSNLHPRLIQIPSSSHISISAAKCLLRPPPPLYPHLSQIMQIFSSNLLYHSFFYPCPQFQQAFSGKNQSILPEKEVGQLSW